MKVKDLIERLGEEDLNTDVYFGDYSEAHERAQFVNIKLELEPIRKDSLGHPYPLLLEPKVVVKASATAQVPIKALIIRKDFFNGKV